MPDQPHNACMCSIHENMLMCISVLAKNRSLPSSGRELVNTIVCNRTNEKCMHMLDTQYSDCKSVKDFYLVVINNVDRRLVWF